MVLPDRIESLVERCAELFRGLGRHGPGEGGRDGEAKDGRCEHECLGSLHASVCAHVGADAEAPKPPRWLAGQMRHGHRGAAEIAQTVDNVFVYAAMAGVIENYQFDLLFAATIGNDVVRGFLTSFNPQAAHAIASRFDKSIRRGLWTTRRNSAATILTSLLSASSRAGAAVPLPHDA